ncbi:family 16 glycoside hydrolase [Anaerobaca lacustris]|uniref:non-reducing end alpha-L-arabinofuranosidase n=1 Tax=Anaerobaca lacustris TaxID=3044600 RepID=A0AAW6U4W6_9BACT|nr:alpha-L-arabinofuranosidase C-terminal domain-containing protein [Sedimentisphaerales bacterium M17dextr]
MGGRSSGSIGWTLFMWAALAATALGQSSQNKGVSYTIDPGKVLNRIDEKVYGHFFEHIYHSANGGLWGELVWNRSFEENSAGRWSIEDDQLVQSGSGTDLRLVFGDRAWTDYEYTLEAQKTGGAEGFLILFRAASDQDYYWYNIGGWGNVRHQLEKGSGGGRRSVGRAVNGQIEKGKWYPIRVRCEGNRYQVWLDGERVLDYTDERSPHRAGQVGISTWSTQAKFRNIEVATLDGKTLYEDLPSLGEDKFGAKHWSVVGPGKVSIESDDPLNSNFCVQIDASAGEAVLEQGAFNTRKDEVYAGSLWARGQASNGLTVRLVNNGDTIIAQQKLGAPGNDWKETKFELRPKVSDANATFQVIVPEGGKIWLDQVSMMPRSWEEAGGFRPDLLQAVAEIRAPIIRWPGGCFASPYRWKDGIGPQHKRRVTPREMWDDLDINSLGTDEFIALCRKVGAEPLIVVNIGTPQWNDDADIYDFLQDALDWIEYCNGPATSKWGKVRAANGHPEPYNVKYWEIDNETWGMGIDDYIAAVKRFAPAMRKADPTIELAACGSGSFDLTWNRRMIGGCGELFEYLSIHHYENPDRFADGPYNYERFIRQTGEIIAASANPRMKIYCSEWNAQSTDWRTGLYAGGMLNGFERCGDVYEIGGPALFLRHVSATGWDNAFINFDQSSWFGAPNYVVMQLWRDHYAPSCIAITPESKTLNTVATKSQDGKTLYVKTVNAGESAVAMSLKLAEGFSAVAATMQMVAPGSLDARNTLARPQAVRAEPGEVRIESNTMRLTLPALSAAVVTIEL